MNGSPPSPAPAPEPSLRLRPLRFEEVAEVLRLVKRAVEHGCRRHYDAHQREIVYLSYAQNLFVEALGPFETIAAETEGVLRGVAQLDPAEGRLRALFVDAGHQQRGLGRALLAEIEARARQKGHARLHGSMALNAVPFYLRAGFSPTGGFTPLSGRRGDIPVMPMSKALLGERPIVRARS